MQSPLEKTKLQIPQQNPWATWPAGSGNEKFLDKPGRKLSRFTTATLAVCWKCTHTSLIPHTDTRTQILRTHIHTCTSCILPVYQMSFVLVCLMPWAAKFMTTGWGDGVLSIRRVSWCNGQITVA